MQKSATCFFLLFTGIAGIASLLTFDASAQNYPVKPIHVLVGFPPGTASSCPTFLAGHGTKFTLTCSHAGCGP